MSAEAYAKALRQGKRVSRSHLLKGESPYLPVLETILKDVEIRSYESLGTIDIPLDQVVGTYYAGRQPSFTTGFLPLMPEGSEFALKWAALCQAHITEGINDPITAYEFMHRFYVVEGHKRVSILRTFGAVSVRAKVTRILPKLGDSEQERLYADFLNFYRQTGLYALQFSHAGNYTEFLKQMGMRSPWTAQEKQDFCSFHVSFAQAFQATAHPTAMTVGDAMLVYFRIYKWADSREKTIPEIRRELSRMSAELSSYAKQEKINLVLKPNTAKPSLFASQHTVRAAFIYDKTPETSSWVYGHELGRRNLEQALADHVETLSYSGCRTAAAVEEAIEDAVLQGCDLIFTTSPRLLSASVKAALKYPKTHILNCSLNTSHPSIRTYYIRMYEAAFVMGAIAGGLTTNDVIGYQASYPIYGMTANINAFALGARMVNPNATIVLQWSKAVPMPQPSELPAPSLSYISDKERISKGGGASMRKIGLYRTDNGIHNIALAFWDWGQMYERIVRTYLHGWKQDVSGTRAINYWWGMDARMVQLICSRSLPDGTGQLVDFLQTGIQNGTFDPFAAVITPQQGQPMDFRRHPLSPNEILTMDWLANNIFGHIPSFDELLPEAQALARIQGVDAL